MHVNYENNLPCEDTEKDITPERLARLKEVLAKRQKGPDPGALQYP